MRQNDRDLDLERLRVELEHHNVMLERTRTYLETLRTEVQHVYESSEKSREMAFNFGRAALQAIFFLNGGALIAFPAFAELISAGIKKNIVFVLLSMASFVLGLCGSTLATLYAFLTMDHDAHRLYLVAERMRIDRLNMWYSSDAKSFKLQTQSEEESDLVKSFDRSRLIAIILGLISLALFVVGCAFAFVVLSSATPD